MHIETEIQIKSNTGKNETLKIEGYYQPQDLAKGQPEIITIILISVLRGGKCFNGSYSLTWEFLFNDTYPNKQDFDKLLGDAVRTEFLIQTSK